MIPPALIGSPMLMQSVNAMIHWNCKFSAKKKGLPKKEALPEKNA
jgi:hypothetical protein